MKIEIQLIYYSYYPRFSISMSNPGILVIFNAFSNSTVGFPRSRSEIKLTLNPVNSDKYV